MPSPTEILSGLTTATNEWRILAFGWHAALALLLFGIAVGWRPSDRTLGRILTLPILSVAFVAWYSINSFNEFAFGLLALTMLGFGRGSTEPIRIASPLLFLSGAALTAFGWVYPHFLRVQHWTEYGYAAPLGVIPCPTLSALIGVALMTGLYRSRVLALTLSLAGLFYGIFGLYRLDVTIDAALAVGALMLVMGTIRRTSEWRSIRATKDEQQRVLPGDELIPFPYSTHTHAITIRRPPREVWPWLAQMGAGTRAGWYSYDFLDNGHKPSATHIIASLQELEKGMIFPALPDETKIFTLMGFERDRYLSLAWAPSELTPLTAWTFVLEEAPRDCTRLIVRAHSDTRYHFPRVPDWLSNRLLPLVNFVMQRRQLHNIAKRVESSEPSRKPTYYDRLMTDAA